jgi:hypothetical protein
MTFDSVQRPGMDDILKRIVGVKREELAAARARRSLADLRRDAEALGGQRDFVGGLRAKVAAGQPRSRKPARARASCASTSCPQRLPRATSVTALPP